MKRTLLLLCCLSFIGLGSSKLTEYKKDVGYNYKYAGYILSGTPDHSNSYTGFLIHATVQLYYIRDKGNEKQFSMHFINPKITKIAGDVSPFAPDRFDSPFKLKQQRKHEKYNGLSKTVLELPVEFTWSKMGHVKSMRKSPKEIQDSLNIKRAVLSMLCGSYGIIPVNHGTTLKLVKGREMAGVEGNCGTFNSFRRTGDSTFEFNKVRRIDNCSKMPFIIESNFPKAFGTSCSRERPSRINADTNTKVLLQRKTSHTFFIDRVQVHSRYGTRGPGRKREDLATYVHLELTFISVASKNGKERSSTKDYETVSLIMDLPSAPDTSKSEKKFMKEVNDTLKIMLSNKHKPEFVKQQFLLVQLLRKASAKQIEKILEPKSTRFTILKLLSAVGTTASIEVLVNKLRDTMAPQEISAALVIASATTSSNPEALAHEFRKMVKDKIFARPSHRETFKAILLGSGTLIGAFRKSDRKSLANQVKTWFHKLMKADLSKLMSDEAKTVILLKSMGNTGFHEIADILKIYLKGDQSLTVRLAAMRAWRKIIRKIPRLTSYTMFRIFANRDEDTEIRINAFMMAMRTGPHGPSRIGYFSHLLMKDTDDNLRNFVMSSLLTLSKVGTKSACFVEMRITARKLLRRLPRSFQEIDKTKSMMFVKPMPTMYWVDLFGYIIYTKDSVLPRTVYISDAMVGENSVAKTFEFQIRSLNNQGNLRKLIERLGIMKKQMKKGNPGNAKFRAKRSAGGKTKGTMVVELSFFGEDVLFKESDTIKMLSKMFTGCDITSGFFLLDHFVQSTSLGLPLTFDRSMGGTWMMKSKPEYKLTRKRQLSLETSNTRSSAYLLAGTLGTSIGKTQAKVALDISGTFNPGGKMSVKAKASVSKGSMGMQISLLPSGEAHKLLLLNLNSYLLLGNEKSSKLQRTEMSLPRKEPSITKVYKSIVGGFPQIKVNRTTGDPKSSIPAYLEIAVLKGSVSGIAIDATVKDIGVKQNDDDDSEEIEQQIEVLKAVDPSGKSDDDVYLLPYSVGSTLALRDMYKIANFRVSLLARQRKATSRPKSENNTILNAYVSLTSKRDSSVNFHMTVYDRKKKLIIRATGKAKGIGPTVYFNPSNPFQVTTNMKRLRQFTLSSGGRTLFSINATSEMSNNWVDSWKSLLKSPKLLSREYPQIHQCILDGQQNSDYSNSPNCIHTWETLQVFDTHKVRLNYARSLQPALEKLNKMVSNRLGSIFTGIKVKQGENQTILQMKIAPMSKKGLRHLRTYRVIRRGLGKSSTCDVGIYKSNGRLLVNSFDRNRYDTLVSSKLFSNRSLIIAQDRFMPFQKYRSIRGGFTVAFSYGKQPYTLVHYVLYKKSCTVKVMSTKDGTETDIYGPGCTDKWGDTNKIEIGSYFVEDAIKVTVPDIQLSVITRPSIYASVTVRKSYYLNSLRGICGNLDGLAREGEFQGKSCKRSVFTDLKKFTSDYIVESPTKVPRCR